jgi:tetratricopeptide (TPR) repeat protein
VDRAVAALEAALRTAADAGVRPPCLARAPRRLASLLPAKYGPRPEIPVPLAHPVKAGDVDAGLLLGAAPDAPAALLLAARAELARGRPAAALLVASRIASSDPWAVEAEELLAAAEVALGLDESAHARWLSLVSRHPERPAALRHLADAALALRDHEGATRWLEALGSSAHGDADVLVNLAFVRRSLGAPDDARAVLERALSLRPDHPPALLALAALLCAEGADPAQGLLLADQFDASGSVPPDPARWRAAREACRALAKGAP